MASRGITRTEIIHSESHRLESANRIILPDTETVLAIRGVYTAVADGYSAKKMSAGEKLMGRAQGIAFDLDIHTNQWAKSHLHDQVGMPPAEIDLGLGVVGLHEVQEAVLRQLREMIDSQAEDHFLIIDRIDRRGGEVSNRPMGVRASRKSPETATLQIVDNPNIIAQITAQAATLAQIIDLKKTEEYSEERHAPGWMRKHR